MAATLSRIFIAPFFLVGLYVGFEHSWVPWTATALFVIGSFSDWLDGYWARKYNVVSTMGKFMDPIADKILVLAALLCLLSLERLDPYMVFLLLGRDLWIGGLRSIAAAEQVIIAAQAFGKWKTALQMLCIPCLFLAPELPLWPLEKVGYWGLWGSVGLSLLSAFQYTSAYMSLNKN